MYLGLRFKVSVMFITLNKTGMFRQFLIRLSNIKLHDNPFGVSPEVTRKNGADRQVYVNTQMLATFASKRAKVAYLHCIQHKKSYQNFSWILR